MGNAVTKTFNAKRIEKDLGIESALERLGQKFMDSLEDETAETFLEAVLAFMKIKLLLDPDYRRNIQDFNGSLQFMSKEQGVTVLIKFKNGSMKIKETSSPDANVTVTFKDGKALMNFLLSANRDILRGLLNNEVTVTGNLNYIYKFGFMANHLQLELNDNLPA